MDLNTYVIIGIIQAISRAKELVRVYHNLGVFSTIAAFMFSVLLWPVVLLIEIVFMVKLFI